MSTGTCACIADSAKVSEIKSELIVSVNESGHVAYWDVRWTNRSSMIGAGTTIMTIANEDINDVDPHQQN